MLDAAVRKLPIERLRVARLHVRAFASASRSPRGSARRELPSRSGSGMKSLGAAADYEANNRPCLQTRPRAWALAQHTPERSYRASVPDSDSADAAVRSADHPQGNGELLADNLRDTTETKPDKGHLAPLRCPQDGEKPAFPSVGFLWPLPSAFMT